MNKVIIVLVVIVAFLAGLFGGYKYEKDKLVSMGAARDAMYMKQISDLKMAQEQAMTPSPAMTAANSVFAWKSDAKLGQYATDTKGMTLYAFDKDTKGVSNCSGTCATLWPPYSAASAPKTLPENISVIKRTDGTMQYAYKDMPLYYYSKDLKSGDTLGDGFAGLWHVIKAQ